MHRNIGLTSFYFRCFPQKAVLNGVQDPHLRTWIKNSANVIQLIS